MYYKHYTFWEHFIAAEIMPKCKENGKTYVVCYQNFNSLHEDLKENL